MCVSAPHPFSCLSNVPLYCRPRFLSPADWWAFGWFPFVSCCGHLMHKCLCWRMFSRLLGSNPVVQLLDHTIRWRLMFLWGCQTVSKADVTVCTLIRNARGHWFPHVFSRTGCFLAFGLFVCLLVPVILVSVKPCLLWLCSASLWWLTVFSTFSHACWLSVSFLWRCVYSDSVPILFGHLPFSSGVVRLYVF